jgi:hypothetical protein
MWFLEGGGGACEDVSYQTDKKYLWKNKPFHITNTEKRLNAARHGTEVSTRVSYSRDLGFKSRQRYWLFSLMFFHFSVPHEKCQNSTLKYTRPIYFHTFSGSSFTVILNLGSVQLKLCW